MKSILVVLILLLPATSFAQQPVTQQPATVGPLQPVPFGWRLFHPFYLGRLRAAKELEQLQGGRWIWQPGRYQFMPSQGGLQK